jgi:hypothetical protein
MPAVSGKLRAVQIPAERLTSMIPPKCSDFGLLERKIGIGPIAHVDRMCCHTCYNFDVPACEVENSRLLVFLVNIA